MDETVKITMVMENLDTGEVITLSKEYADSATWNDISAQYFRFLCAKGYVLNSDDVGAEFV